MVNMAHAVLSGCKHTLGSAKMVLKEGCAYIKAKSNEKGLASAQKGCVDSQPVILSSVLIAKVDCINGKTSLDMQIARAVRGTSSPIMNSSLDRGKTFQSSLHPDNLQSMPDNLSNCADEHVRQGWKLRRWLVYLFPLSLQAS